MYYPNKRHPTYTTLSPFCHYLLIKYTYLLYVENMHDYCAFKIHIWTYEAHVNVSQWILIINSVCGWINICSIHVICRVKGRNHKVRHFRQVSRSVLSHSFQSEEWKKVKTSKVYCNFQVLRLFFKMANSVCYDFVKYLMPLINVLFVVSSF